MGEAQDDPDRLWAWLSRLRLLTDLIGELVRRTWTATWSIPLLCLVRPTARPSLLPALARLLGNRGRQIPHAVLDATGSTPERLVLGAAEQLRRDRFGARPLRLPHVTLLVRVFDARIPEEDSDNPNRALARELAAYYRVDLRGLGFWERIPSAPLYLLIELLVWCLPGVLLRLRTWRRMAWFRDYEHERTGRRTSFLSYGARLTEGARDSEEPAEVRRLMVAALLRDMRVLYRRNRARWHRTAYPVLLLDNVERANAGGALLALINELRNEKGGDPLLVISSGTAGYVDEPAPLADLGSRYQVWTGDLPEARRQGSPDAWMLGVTLPEEDLTGPAGRHRPMTAPRPPRWAHRGIKIAAAAVVLLLVAGAGLRSTPSDWLPGGCRPVHAFWAGHIDVTRAGAECVGYSDSTAQLLGHDPAQRALQEDVFQQNDHVDEQRDRFPRKPWLTLIYLTSLTRPDGQSGDVQYVAEREALAGIAAAQKQANEEAANSDASPYVRIVVANTGQQGAQAATVIPKLIELAEDDRSVLGAIAVVDSRDGVVRALKKLSDEAHLLVVTPTMTADNVASESRLFLRMSALNRSSARLVQHYVTKVLKRTDIHNFYTYGSGGLAAAKDDLYVNTLREGMQAQFGSHYREDFWSDGHSLREVCSDRYDGVVFFGGRYTEFFPFLQQLAGDCGANRPIVVADGSVVRFLANAAKRASAPPTGPLVVVADGYLGSCARLTTSSRPEQRLYLGKLGGNCAPDELGIKAAGWSVLSFDAVRLLTWHMRQSVTDAGLPPPGGSWQPGAPVNSLSIHNKIMGRSQPYEGVTGPIKFGTDGTVVNRYQSLLCVPVIAQAYIDLAHVPTEVDSMGLAYPNNPAPSMKPCR